MSAPLTPDAARTAHAALLWQIELGADEAIGDEPVDRFALPERRERPVWVGSGSRQGDPAPRPEGRGVSDAAAEPAKAARIATPRPATTSQAAAERSPAPDLAHIADLAALRAAMMAVEEPLRDGAQTFVFADGSPGAHLMIVGEAPGRDEDREGLPFVGASGRLLDRMLAAIGRDRRDVDPARGAYITNVLPWRPPGNRRPEPAEIARWSPYLMRHIALAAPRVVLALGNTPLHALVGRGGITMLRGQWMEAEGRPLLASYHPSYLLRDARHKREAWADLLEVAARLEGP